VAYRRNLAVIVAHGRIIDNDIVVRPPADGEFVFRRDLLNYGSLKLKQELWHCASRNKPAPFYLRQAQLQKLEEAWSEDQECDIGFRSASSIRNQESPIADLEHPSTISLSIRTAGFKGLIAETIFQIGDRRFLIPD
jgi:hypothetical protein